MLGSASEATAAIEGYNGELNKTPPAKDTRLNNNAFEAGLGVSAYVRQLEASERTYTSRVVTRYETIGDRPGIAPQLTGYATGGHISGPGTGTSDSILARLSNNEFVIRSAAVDHYGPGLLHAINSMRLPRFASGGPVGGSNMSAPTMMGGVVELGPKSLARLSANVVNNIMIDDVTLSRKVQSGNEKRRAGGDFRA